MNFQDRDLPFILENIPLFQKIDDSFSLFHEAV